MHLVDNETKVDLLNNEPIAATVIKLLRSMSHTAVTVSMAIGVPASHLFSE
jgi:hypothetical protein